MPELGFFHPIVVHFAIALLVFGVLLRLVSLTGKVPFANHAALTLLVVGALATVVAAESGEDAHGVAERIPGVGPLVREHEELGERSRNIFLAVAVLEIAALVVSRRREKWARYALILSAVVGVVGLAVLYEAAEHGGELVYAYAGGVGTRSGEPEDVGHLLLAGIYQQARLDRQAGERERAAELWELASRRFADDVEVRLAYADSLLHDRGDAAAALAVLQGLEPPAGGFLQLRHGLLRAEALKASGDVEAGRAELDRLAAIFPQSRMLQRARESF